MSNAPLTIGAMAKAAGTKVVTIRYYEKIGLLPPPDRTGGNYRAYEAESLERLLFIRRCRELGFTLDQIRELLRLSSQEDRACCDVDRITTEHLTAAERKIADLNRLASELRRINDLCRGDGQIANCRIVEVLGSGCAAQKTDVRTGTA